MFARVIIDINHFDVNQIYDYIVPSNLEDLILVGSRIVVPFGNQVRVAFVYELTSTSDNATKEVIEVIDLKPIMDEESFLIKDYLASINDKTDAKLIQTIITPERMFNYHNKYLVVNEGKINSELSKYVKKGYLTFDSNDKQISLLVKKEIELNNVKVIKAYKQKAGEKLTTYVTINNNYTLNIKDNDLDIVEFLKTDKKYTKSELVTEGFSLSKINRLIKNETLKTLTKRNYRVLDIDIDLSIKKIDKLTVEQDRALETYFNNNHQVSLLHGVTASGKTEVYINIIKDVISKNKQALFLVPDISLIYQVYQRLILEPEFNVVMYHSRLSKGLRYDAIDAIENNLANVLLGTRSASFIKFPNLGVIVMDEAHDQSYLQEEDVFYDTFEVAKIKSNISNSRIILGSATPSVSHFYHAKNNHYLLLELPKKAVKVSDVKIHVVDMKRELSNGNTSIISKHLDELIIDKLSKGEQILILFNQKGYAPFAMCRTCGHVPKDPKTSLSLLYDKKDNVLRSRQTKYQIPFSNTCPICDTNALNPVGVGILYVEEYLKKRYKDYVIRRLDSSVMTKKGAYESLIDQFKNQEINILVGTQMISKGLDFKNVTLSVVLMADTFLNVPSNLASEQAYMTLTQMIGRSARHLNGDAVIQSYDVDNLIIKSLDKQYKAFYKEAIYEREVRRIEPFYKVVQVAFYGNRYLHTYQEALKFIKEFDEKIITLGPSEVFYKHAKYEFGFSVTLKFLPKDDVDLSQLFNKVSNQVFVSVKSVHQIL